MGRKLESLVGRRFGRWQVIVGPTRKGKQYYYQCTCDCGTTGRMVEAASLRSGESQSCGCLSAELAGQRAKGRPTRTRDPQKISPAYVTWKSMVQRCYLPTSGSYHRYGAKGISVCERWRDSFENFLADMGERLDGRSLDRIDSKGNYEPSNCRWATHKEQNRNHSGSAKIAFRGRSLSFAEWAEITGLPAHVIRRRIRYSGWSVDRALTVPKK